MKKFAVNLLCADGTIDQTLYIGDTRKEAENKAEWFKEVRGPGQSIVIQEVEVEESEIPEDFVDGIEYGEYLDYQKDNPEPRRRKK